MLELNKKLKINTSFQLKLLVFKFLDKAKNLKKLNKGV